MIRKTKLSAVILGLAVLAGADIAAACSVAQWGAGAPPGGGVVGAPVAGDPAANGVKRYGGLCGLRSAAPANYVQDGTPAGASEGAYIGRFYVFTGTGTGEATIFQGVSGSENIINIAYNNTGSQATSGFRFRKANGATFDEVANIRANSWYSIEFNWNRTAATLDVVVQGNGTAAVDPAAFTGHTSSGGTVGIDFVRLGWISGGAGTEVVVDAFESRRATAIGRLLRGDSNGSGSITIGDATALVTEVNGGALAGGAGTNPAPECNEQGGITIGDASCVVGIVNQ
ncbi:MAG: hypothetical protein IPK97_00370 [Ahniella sp.]|nr:hypothetical protein [Ahniella sp.]